MPVQTKELPWLDDEGCVELDDASPELELVLLEELVPVEAWTKPILSSKNGAGPLFTFKSTLNWQPPTEFFSLATVAVGTSN